MKKIKQITIPVASEVNDGAPGSATLAANVAVLVAQLHVAVLHQSRRAQYLAHPWKYKFSFSRPFQ